MAAHDARIRLGDHVAVTGLGGGTVQAQTAAYVLSRAADATRGQVMVATVPTSHYPPASGFRIRCSEKSIT